MTDEARPVLLISGGHTLQPLWQPLSETYDLCMLHPQSSGLMNDLGIQGAFGVQKYLTAELQEKAVNIAYRLSAKLHEPSMSASLAKVVSEAFNGNPPENLSQPQIGEWWPAMVGEHIKQEATLVGLLDAVMNDRKISGCVVHEDVTPDQRAIVLFCKAHGIPTVHVPHANCFYTGKSWDIHTESISDYIAAAGTHMRDFYVRWGFPADKVRVTGVPHWDSWYNTNQPTKAEARKVLGVDENVFLFIYATSWGQLTSDRGGFEQEFENGLRQVLETTRELNATLCIKMHPSEAQGQEQIYLNALKENNINGFVTRQFNEYVLRAGDALVAHGPSNICVTSAFIGLPCVYLSTEDFEFPFPGPVKSGVSLAHAIRISQLLDGDKTWDIFSKVCNDAHGKGNATDRTAEFVREVCQ